MFFIVSGFIGPNAKPINKTIIVEETSKATAKLVAADKVGACWSEETLCTSLNCVPVTFRIDPMGKPRMTQRDKWKPGPAVQRYWQFKDELRRQAGQLNFQLADAFEVDFFIPMPQSWSKKQKLAMLGQPHRQKPDADNLVKSLKDSLCVDDSYIWNEHVRKWWSLEGLIMVANVVTEYTAQA